MNNIYVLEILQACVTSLVKIKYCSGIENESQSDMHYNEQFQTKFNLC